MVGTNGTLSRKKFTIVLNKMKAVLLAVFMLMLAGCATNNDYQVYVDAQKAISKDLTITEAARMNALIEMTKSADPAVRATAIMQLQSLQQNSKQIIIEPPKKNIFGF
jgi:hypothetical protein